MTRAARAGLSSAADGELALATTKTATSSGNRLTRRRLDAIEPPERVLVLLPSRLRHVGRLCPVIPCIPDGYLAPLLCMTRLRNQLLENMALRPQFRQANREALV